MVKTAFEATDDFENIELRGGGFVRRFDYIIFLLAGFENIMIFPKISLSKIWKMIYIFDIFDIFKSHTSVHAYVHTTSREGITARTSSCKLF